MSKDYKSFTDYTINNNKIAWWLVKNNKNSTHDKSTTILTEWQIMVQS